MDLAKGAGEWHSEGRVLLTAEAALHCRRRQGFSPPLDHETCIRTWLNEGRTPSFPGWSSHYPSAGCSAASRPSPHPEGHHRPSEEIGSAVIYCVPSCVYPTWADSVMCERTCACFQHGYPSAVLPKPWKIWRQKRYNQKVNRWSWLWTQWGSTEVVAWRNSLGTWGSATSRWWPLLIMLDKFLHRARMGVG